MFRSFPRALSACAMVLLAATGCSFDDIDRATAMLPAADAQTQPAGGHEVHRMFEAEKSNAAMGELPAQF